METEETRQVSAAPITVGTPRFSLAPGSGQVCIRKPGGVPAPSPQRPLTHSGAAVTHAAGVPPGLGRPGTQEVPLPRAQRAVTGPGSSAGTKARPRSTGSVRANSRGLAARPSCRCRRLCQAGVSGGCARHPMASSSLRPSGARPKLAQSSAWHLRGRPLCGDRHLPRHGRFTCLGASRKSARASSLPSWEPRT